MRLSKNVAEQTVDKTRGMSTYLLANARNVACENIRFSSLFAAGDVSRGGSELLRLSGRNSILVTKTNVYIKNPVVMGFQIQIVQFYVSSG